ncbi:hypothetical protein EVG20_g10539 [Dentipellis fragilis]|uniref:Uncharacterized protein n=1 Tax=Dentipellis fragilis TaxID=205917 RepID=A0A4Y9XQ78_9AGAM|nr:hypothetical protein EVG20_g10539 [Dentipellis fragilis]
MDLQFLPAGSIIQDDMPRRPSRVLAQNPYPSGGSSQLIEDEVHWDWDLKPLHWPSTETPDANGVPEMNTGFHSSYTSNPHVNSSRLPYAPHAMDVQEQFSDPFRAPIHAEVLDTTRAGSGMGRPSGSSSRNYDLYSRMGPSSEIQAPLARVAQQHHDASSHMLGGPVSSSSRVPSDARGVANFGRHKTEFAEADALSSFQYGLTNFSVNGSLRPEMREDEVDQIIDDWNKYHLSSSTSRPPTRK